jgi:hypothetical protein
LTYHIGGVMVSVLVSSVVDHGLESWLGQTIDDKIGMCCFSAKHEELRWKSKDWFARNQNNVSEWSNMSVCLPVDCCFSELTELALKIQLSVMV